ncbi:MAG: hypothetical protein LBM76_01885 [Mycoplasmataceae bacterium]|nr:hypothetical protein [Mycoplasmataceae bacterium]
MINKKRNIALFAGVVCVGIAAIVAPIITSCGSGNGGNNNNATTLVLENYDFGIEEITTKLQVTPILNMKPQWDTILLTDIPMPGNSTSMVFLLLYTLMEARGIYACGFCTSEISDVDTDGSLLVMPGMALDPSNPTAAMFGVHHLYGLALSLETADIIFAMEQGESPMDYSYVVHGDAVKVDINIFDDIEP